MANLNLTLLYVDDTTASSAFYEGILGRPPAVAAPNFAAFALDGGVTLGLWAKHSVRPLASDAGARGELGFMVATPAEIDVLYAEWKTRGLAIEQELTTLDFGPTFVALDPDGHRLRVCLFDN